MRKIRDSSLDEYVTWYLQRQQRKGEEPGVIPDSPADRLRMLDTRHNKTGSKAPWFRAAAWSIWLVEHPEEFERLVYFESEWTVAEGLTKRNDGKNYRWLGQVAKNAIRGGYLKRPSAARHLHYYQELKAGRLRLQGEDRLVLRTLSSSEHENNPAGVYYIHDGSGRALPYQILVSEGMTFQTVEVFLAEEVN
jgi:hypothetical protein